MIKRSILLAVLGLSVASQAVERPSIGSGCVSTGLQKSLENGLSRSYSGLSLCRFEQHVVAEIRLDAQGRLLVERVGNDLPHLTDMLFDGLMAEPLSCTLAPEQPHLMKFVFSMAATDAVPECLRKGKSPDLTNQILLNIADKSPSDWPADLQYDEAPAFDTVERIVLPAALARKSALLGRARMSLLVDERGEVSVVRIEGATEPALAASLKAAAATWRMKPARRAGRATATVLTMGLILRVAEFPSDLAHPFVQVAQGGSALLHTQRDKLPGIDALDAPLQPLYQPPIEIPDIADPSLSGRTIQASAIVDKTGRVHWPEVATPIHVDIDAAVIHRLGQWRFYPPLMAGKPVQVRLQVDVQIP